MFYLLIITQNFRNFRFNYLSQCISFNDYSLFVGLGDIYSEVKVKLWDSEKTVPTERDILRKFYSHRKLKTKYYRNLTIDNRIPFYILAKSA